MKEHLHGGPPETADIESLRNEVADLRQKVDQLTAENSDLKQRVSTRNLSIERGNNNAVRTNDIAKYLFVIVVKSTSFKMCHEIIQSLKN